MGPLKQPVTHLSPCAHKLVMAACTSPQRQQEAPREARGEEDGIAPKSALPACGSRVARRQGGRARGGEGERQRAHQSRCIPGAPGSMQNTDSQALGRLSAKARVAPPPPSCARAWRPCRRGVRQCVCECLHMYASPSACACPSTRGQTFLSEPDPTPQSATPHAHEPICPCDQTDDERLQRRCGRVQSKRHARLPDDQQVANIGDPGA